MKVHQVVVAVVAALALASSALAQVEQVKLRFDGLSCPFCVYNVEKQVKKIPGVDRTTPVGNDLKRGLIWFDWDSARPFSPEAIRKAAEHSGFTLREMRVSAQGQVDRPSDADPELLRLTDPNTGRGISVTPGSRVDRREAWDALRVRAADTPKPIAVRLEGAVEEQGSSWRLVLHRWSPVDFGAVVELEVDGFACERCATRTMKALRASEGVIHVEANHETGRVQVWTTSDKPAVAKIREQIEALGFTVKRVHTHTQADAHEDGE